jgi:hypothetical protein
MKVSEFVRRGLAAALAAGALLTILGAVQIPVIAATSLPFQDRSANGYIGLCDRQGHAITSGSIYDQPFVWTAVSSTPTYKGYEKGKAVLLAYQPRKDVDPGEWSGRQLTAASSFTNPKHPMAQATNADDPLLFFLQSFPPRWDGLVQLRMHYGAPDSPTLQNPYPATVIRVTGERWTVVSGGKADCGAGSAVSDETKNLPKVALAAVPTLKVNGVVKGSQATSSPAPSASSNTQDVASGISNTGGGSAFSVVAVALAGIAVIGGGLAGLYVWRRRRSPIET